VRCQAFGRLLDGHIGYTEQGRLMTLLERILRWSHTSLTFQPPEGPLPAVSVAPSMQERARATLWRHLWLLEEPSVAPSPLDAKGTDRSPGMTPPSQGNGPTSTRENNEGACASRYTSEDTCRLVAPLHARTCAFQLRPMRTTSRFPGIDSSSRTQERPPRTPRVTQSLPRC
jgi:hypothetical protein